MFRCPAYILDNALQGQHTVPKWKQRSWLGENLGLSPNHSRTVHVILNPCMGHVSLQFHVKHDDFFETVKQNKTTFDSP